MYFIFSLSFVKYSIESILQNLLDSAKNTVDHAKNPVSMNFLYSLPLLTYQLAFSQFPSSLWTTELLSHML